METHHTTQDACPQCVAGKTRLISLAHLTSGFLQAEGRIQGCRGVIVTAVSQAS